MVIIGEKNFQSISKVGIIGGGVSGIAAAKQLSRYQPVVFEATDYIGGVWKHCSYNSTKLQTPRCDYEFSDFPWPQRDNSSFPSHVEILDYLNAYAGHFDVLKYVRFNSKVVEVRFIDRDQEISTIDAHNHTLLSGKPMWEVAVRVNQDDTIQWYAFEFLVMCAGKYGDIPKLPVLPKQKGPEIFNGMVLHSLDYAKLDKESASQLLKGKKVVIIGYKKSAIDLAVECAEANQEIWTEADHPFEEDYASCQMAILPDNFFEEADKGRILFKRVSKWWFWSGGVQLEDNTKLDADVVLLATGYDGKKKLKALLPEPFFDILQDSSGIIPLYRGTIHPLIPWVAFVGYVESVSNLHSAELRCKWLSRLLDNQFKLPSVQKMLEYTTKEMEVMKRTTKFYKRNCISTYIINHNDEICEDMGWRPWRKTNWFSEVFGPYSNQDYQEHK
ncbi:hypothetical protein Scep_008019 [Stephania cephalantha]|uniref:Flavin-containing monooxygenase n=1 Tax=Stephania cephalantha TaxID=152367 RepID=A0AAP0KB77_9MAGN